MPSLASVFNEYALKSQFDTSVHLQVFFFYILSCPQPFGVTLVACWNILCFFFVFMLLTLYNLAYKVVRFHVLYLFWSLRSFSWIALQNLFLYGYGALFNLLAILCTAIYQGTYFWFCLMVSVCSWGLQPHLGFSGFKRFLNGVQHPSLESFDNSTISYVNSEYCWVLQGQEQEVMDLIFWKGIQRQLCFWSSTMQLRVSFPHFSSNMQVSLVHLDLSDLVIPFSLWASQIIIPWIRSCPSR